nr:hypothetical protein [Deltaproteobacteria bacterium]
MQTSRAPSAVQRALPGVQSRAAQRLSASQNWLPASQSLSPPHSTQTIRVGWQTRPMSLHCREEVQLRGRVTQLFARHCWMEGQSASTLQSTQKPRVVSQTWPGHCRVEVHAVDATQRWLLHVRSDPVQSALVRHSTQTPRSRSHTCPCGAQGLSDWQLVAAATTSPERSAQDASEAHVVASIIEPIDASKSPPGPAGLHATTAIAAHPHTHTDKRDRAMPCNPSLVPRGREAPTRKP